MTIAHYNLLDPLGSGGSGQAFRARDARRGRTVVIKLLPEEFRTDPERRVRLLREAHALTALSHPNIATLYEVGEDDQLPFLVFEFVPGRTLRQIIGGQPLPVHVALDRAAEIADALAEAHAREILHGDLRPDNVIVTPKGHAKVLDFGLASWTRGGAASYTSPEQIRQEPLDPRADIYSLGAVLYEMLTGRAPLDESTPTSASPRAVNPAVPEDLDAVVLRALADRPEHRFASAAELAAALRNIVSVSVPDTRHRAPLPAYTVQPRRRLRRWLRLAVVLAGLVGAGAWFRQPAERLWRRWVGPAPSPVVAVMPFEATASGDTYFADGVAADLVTALGRTPGLRVVGRSAMRDVRGRPLGEVAAELGAGTILTGVAGRAGDRVHITVGLVEPDNGMKLWSQQFTGELREVLALHTEIAERVARELGISLAPSAARARTAARLVDTGAYDAYLRARELAARRTLGPAIRLFEQAAILDPGLAEAYVGLAEAMYRDGLTRGSSGLPPLPRVREALESAAEIDPDLPELHLTLGLTSLRLSDALGHLRRAIELDPTIAEAYHDIGDAVAAFDLDGAARFYRKALEIDPRFDSSRRHLASVAVLSGRIGDVEPVIARSRRHGSDRPWHHDLRMRAGGPQSVRADLVDQVGRRDDLRTDVTLWLNYVVVLVATGRQPAALNEAAQVVDHYPDSCMGRAVLAALEIDGGNRTEGIRAAQALLTSAETADPASAAYGCAAIAAAALGDPLAAAGWLRRLAADERALRAWGVARLVSSIGSPFPTWYPWTKIVPHPAVEQASRELEVARLRMKVVAEKALAGLPGVDRN